MKRIIALVLLVFCLGFIQISTATADIAPKDLTGTWDLYIWNGAVATKPETQLPFWIAATVVMRKGTIIDCTESTFSGGTFYPISGRLVVDTATHSIGGHLFYQDSPTGTKIFLKASADLNKSTISGVGKDKKGRVSMIRMVKK